MKTKKQNKYKNLVKIMQLPGTTMDESAKKQMSKYAKFPKSYLKDVNELVGQMAKEITEKKKKKMNRYAITIKYDRTATFYVDGETMEEAKDEIIENYDDYYSNGMDDISLEVKDIEVGHTNIEQDKEVRIINSAELIEERRKKLTKFNHEKEEKSYG